LDKTVKNREIRAALRKTRAKRKNQTCRTYELKIDSSHLNAETQEHLKRLFLEAKWFYNSLIASGKADRDGLWNADYKVKTVKVKKEEAFEERELRCLSSQMRQEIINRTRDNIRGLARRKQAGGRVGGLKFKGQVDSIPLNQHGTTYRISGSRIHIQKLRPPLRVRGLEQMPEGAEYANATLIRRNGDYYVHVTTYQPKPAETFKQKSIGTDFGIRKQLVLSNGVEIEEQVPLTKGIRRLHRRLSRKKKGGKNRAKAQEKLDRAYEALTRQRRDVRNKIAGKLTKTFEIVCVQNDNVAGWQGLWGRRILATAIGGLMSALNKAHTPVMVDRFYPSTKTCSRCGAVKEVGLEERIYRCSRCGLEIDRNLNAAINIEVEGLKSMGVPVVRREFTPVDTKTAAELVRYFNSIWGVRASLVVEAGSLTASA
jgi:putative transposase